MIDCTDEQLIEEVRRRGFVIRDARITLTAPFTEEHKMFAYKKKWVGLTDEELGKVVLANLNETLWTLTKDIEAKLKEKNT